MDRIARYSGLKTRARDMADYINALREPANRPDLEKVFVNLKQCANYLVFNDYYTVEQVRLVKAQTCKKHLLCPFCAARRAAKLVEKNLPRVEEAMASQRSLKPAMLTLTVKNGPDLTERHRHLVRSLKRLMRRRSDCIKGQKWTETAKIAGGIISHEFTKKGEGGWHPHVHMLVLLNDWIDQKALVEEWHEITGDSFIVDIRRIKPKALSGGVDIASGLLEVCKYALKFHDLTLEDTWEAFNVLRGKRLVDSFGALRGLKMPESLLDDPLDDLPFLEKIYRYSSRAQAYDLIQLTSHDDLPVAGEPTRSRHAAGLPALMPARASRTSKSLRRVSGE